MGTAGCTDLTLLGRLLRQVRPYGALVAASFLLSLLASPLALLAPLPLAIAVDSAIGSRPLPHALAAVVPAAAQNGAGALVLAAGLMLAITLLIQAQAVASSLLNTYASERLLIDFR